MPAPQELGTLSSRNRPDPALVYPEASLATTNIAIVPRFFLTIYTSCWELEENLSALLANDFIIT